MSQNQSNSKYISKQKQYTFPIFINVIFPHLLSLLRFICADRKNRLQINHQFNSSKIFNRIRNSKLKSNVMHMCLNHFCPGHFLWSDQIICKIYDANICNVFRKIYANWISIERMHAILCKHFEVHLWIHIYAQHFHICMMIFAMNAIKLHANYKITNFGWKWIIFIHRGCVYFWIFLVLPFARPSSVLIQSIQ